MNLKTIWKKVIPKLIFHKDNYFVLLFILSACSTLSQVSDPAPVVQYYVSWRPDSKAIAVGGQNIRIFTDNLQDITSIKTDPDIANIQSEAWSPDGDQLIGISVGGHAIVWNTATGKGTVIFQNQKNITSAMWSNDSKEIATSSADKTVQIWNAKTFQNSSILTGHTGEVFSIVWSPANDKLASGSDDGTVKIWNVKTADLITTLSTSIKHVYSVAWSPDGSKIAATGASGQVLLWDTSKWTLQATIATSGGTSSAFQVTWNPTGTQFAVAVSNEIQVWDVEKKQTIFAISNSDGAVYTVAWSPDGSKVASIGGNNILRIWDAVTSKLLVERQLQ
jgi:WD40 repeat protein